MVINNMFTENHLCNNWRPVQSYTMSGARVRDIWAEHVRRSIILRRLFEYVSKMYFVHYVNPAVIYQSMKFANLQKETVII